MVLTNDLISSLVKMTKDKPLVKSDTKLFATVVKYNGADYVKLDGSELLTPVISTTETQEDDRVLVDIKNHSAIITHNISDPSASGKKVEEVSNQISEFEIVIADKVSTDELDAQIGRIDTLVSDNVVIRESLEASKADISDLQADYVTVSGKLTAAEAEIERLDTEKLTATQADLKYATTENLDATNADIYNLEATYGDFVVLTTDKFEAIDATIDNLDATYATITDMDVERARIDDLEATQAVIDSLEADVADINTLIFGSATGNVIQTSFANAVVAQIGNAQIKSAMIESVSADKITAGDIITNNVRVMSEDGSLIISDETMQISDENRVRVQIGKDVSGDYSINVWDADGNLMFSEGGITDNAIKTAIIRNDMVSDDADISAYKLNIDSLFSAINEDGTNTIKSSQIYLNDEEQRLDVAFTEMITDVDGLSDTVSSQGTQLSVVQGQISSKVWQQDIDIVAEDVETLTTQYSSLDQAVDSILVTVASHTSEIEEKADKTTVTEVQDKVSELEINLNGFQTTVSEIYATKTEMGEAVEGIEIGGRNLIKNSNFANGMNYWVISEVTAEVVSDDTFGQCLKFTTETADSNHRIYPDTVGNFTHASGEEYTLSFWAKANEETSIQNNVASALNITSHLLTTEWKRCSVTYTAESTGSLTLRSNYDGVTVYLANVKLEKGNKATDWTPAPEDLVSSVDFTEAKTQITQNSNAISAAAQRITNNEKSISTLTQTADGLTSKVENMEIGGRNLIVVSSLQDGYRMGGTGEDYVSAYSSLTSDISVRQGEELTYTVYEIYTDEGDTYFQLAFYEEDGTFISRPIMVQANTTTEKTSWITEVPENAVYARVAFPTSLKNKVKLEYGNKATDWTPAPEDMATAGDVENAQSIADHAHSLIQQLSDCIATLVTDGNGASLMTQTENGWTFGIGQITDDLSSVSNSLNDLINEVGDTNNTVTILEQAVNDLGVLANYVKITTDGDQPCIELGTGNSDFKLLITNTDIRFMEGSSVVAYINNQTLHITKVIINEELQQGEFVWKVRSNGNLGLQWKGGNG